MLIRAIASCAMLAGVGLAVPAQARETSAASASFLVVHGIPGRAVGAGVDPLLPVDVLVGGKYCLLQGLTFGQIAGPFDVPAGKYSVAVSLANPIAPCSNAAVITATANLVSGSFSSVVAAVSSAGAPAAEIYALDVSPVAAGKQRFVTAHAADAPAVSVKAVALGNDAETLTFGLSPGKENNSVVSARRGFAVTAQPAAGGRVIGPVDVRAGDHAVIALFAVGVAQRDAVTLLSKVIPDVY